MKFVTLLVAMIALSQSAIAQTPAGCKAIADSTARLACFDKAVSDAAPAPAAPRPALRATPVAHADSTKYVDTIGAEDAAVNAMLKNICRGC